MAFLIGLALAISDGPRLAQLAGPQQFILTVEKIIFYQYVQVLQSLLLFCKNTLKRKRMYENGKGAER